MQYKAYTPVPELQMCIKCFWTLEDDAADEPVRQRVVPDGCMEMIFNYGDLYRQYFEDGSSIIQPRSFVFGQLTKYLEIAPTGTTGIVSARFLPDGLVPFITIPVSELQDKAVDIHIVFGEKGKLLEEKILSAPDNELRIQLVQDFLLSLLIDKRTIDKITKDCVDAIFQTQGQLDISGLANKTNMNRRNMERRFTAAIGLSPKQLSKVVRLQAALKMLGENKFTSLTSLAYENGYYDQAHFIKDFKEFTGMSPKSFFKDNLKLSALFIAAE